MRTLPIAPDDPRARFSVPLVLFDAVPVTLFCANCLLMSQAMASPAFAAGAVVGTLSGLLKVVWKLVVVTRRTDVPVLSRQMRVVMPAAFCLLAVGILCSDHAAAVGMLQRLAAPPAGLLVTLWAVALVAMGVFAAKLDHTQPRSNWLEESTNALGQLCFLVALLIA